MILEARLKIHQYSRREKERKKERFISLLPVAHRATVPYILSDTLRYSTLHAILYHTIPY